MGDLARWWPLAGRERLRERLEEAYGAADRGYHDRRHLAEVLGHVADLADRADAKAEPDVVLLAAWFHDAVHASRPDDEERSARLAEQELAAAGLPAERVREVARLVRLTAGHRPADDDLAGQLLCDADLAILAADEERYADYVAGVRREYAHLDDAGFRAGRAAVLRDLLARPTLFHTAAARERWEQPARVNVATELEILG